MDRPSGSGGYPPSQGGYPPSQGGYPPPPGGYMGGPGFAPGPMPDNYLVLSILAIFCCWPLAIPALINATQVQSKWSTGDFAGAQAASQQAKRWATIAIVLGVVWIVIVLLLWVAAAVFSLSVFNWSSTVISTFATATPLP